MIRKRGETLQFANIKERELHQGGKKEKSHETVVGNQKGVGGLTGGWGGEEEIVPSLNSEKKRKALLIHIPSFRKCILDFFQKGRQKSRHWRCDRCYLELKQTRERKKRGKEG